MKKNVSKPIFPQSDISRTNVILGDSHRRGLEHLPARCTYSTCFNQTGGELFSWPNSSIHTGCPKKKSTIKGLEGIVHVRLTGEGKWTFPSNPFIVAFFLGHPVHTIVIFSWLSRSIRTVATEFRRDRIR